MTKVEIKELNSVLEEIRAEKYPELPESLVQDIVSAEFENQDDTEKASKSARQVIDNFLRNMDV